MNEGEFFTAVFQLRNTDEMMELENHHYVATTLQANIINGCCGRHIKMTPLASLPGTHTLCDPLPLSVGGTCDLLLTNKTQQR